MITCDRHRQTIETAIARSLGLTSYRVPEELWEIASFYLSTCDDELVDDACYWLRRQGNTVTLLSIMGECRRRETRGPMLALAYRIADHNGVCVSDIRGPDRRVAFVLPRHEFCYRAHKEEGQSLSDIGRFLGGRDHTTVINGIRRHEERLAKAGADMRIMEVVG